jgi:hypothetical protein
MNSRWPCPGHASQAQAAIGNLAFDDIYMTGKINSAALSNDQVLSCKQLPSLSAAGPWLAPRLNG